MAYAIYRLKKTGERALVAWADDPCEIGTVIDEDRKKLDESDPAYEVVQE